MTWWIPIAGVLLVGCLVLVAIALAGIAKDSDERLERHGRFVSPDLTADEARELVDLVEDYAMERTLADSAVSGWLKLKRALHLPTAEETFDEGPAHATRLAVRADAQGAGKHRKESNRDA